MAAKAASPLTAIRGWLNRKFSDDVGVERIDTMLANILYIKISPKAHASGPGITSRQSPCR